MQLGSVDKADLITTECVCLSCCNQIAFGKWVKMNHMPL